MDNLFNELLQLLEKTTVIVEFDKTRYTFMNVDQTDVDPKPKTKTKTKPIEEDKYYLYTIRVDGYASFEKYCERIDVLIQNFNEEIESRIDNKLYYKEVKVRLNKLKSIIVPYYSKLDINFFSDQTHITKIGPKRSFYFEPNISIKYINGNALDSDYGEFRIIEKFVEKKFYLAKRMEAIAKSSLELLKEQGVNKKLGTFKFLDEDLLNSQRLDNFRKGLIDNKLIDKIDARLFAKCFSGKEVEEKINWINKEISLVYFIRKLKSYLLNSKRVNWIAVSNIFLLNSETIDHKKISTASTKIECSKKIRGIIDAIIKQLEPKTSVLIPK